MKRIIPSSTDVRGPQCQHHPKHDSEGISFAESVPRTKPTRTSIPTTGSYSLEGVKRRRKKKTRATIEVHHFFFSDDGFSILGAQNLSKAKKTDLG